MDRFVGLGEIQICAVPGDFIKTFALASCVGITAYCRTRHIAGMIHIVLPQRPDNLAGATSPSYYASTGVPLFIERMLSHGCKKSELCVNVYGGASSQGMGGYFNIGLRNLTAVRGILDGLGVSYRLAGVGGCISRTLHMNVSTGEVTVNTLPIPQL